MRHEQRLFGIALTLLTSGALVSIAMLHSRSIQKHSSAPRVERQPAEAAVVRHAPAVAAQTNPARACELSFRQDFSAGQGSPNRIRVTATLEMAPRDSAGRDLVKIGPVASEGEGAPAARDLALVFARVHDASGRLEAVEVPRATPAEARRYLKAIAAALQYTRPADETVVEWQATELDVGGRFTSSYRRKEGGGVERSRRFLDNPGRAGVPVDVRLFGRTAFRFEPSGQLASLETEERAEISADPAWRLQAELAVSLTCKGEVPTRWQTLAHDLERESVMVNEERAEQASAETDRKRVAGRSLGDLRAEAASLEALPQAMERTRERSRLLLDHAALARLEPAALKEMIARLKDSATEPAETSLLAGALGAAGTLDASHALTEVLAGATTPGARMQAAVSLNVTTAHDETTLAALQSGMADPDPEVAGASALALGNALRTQREAGGANPNAADALARAYANARSIEERTQALRAIGNSGDPTLLPLLEHALSERSSDVQEAAAYSLRFMDAAADPLLARALGSPFPEVRTAAVRAIEFRPVDALVPALEGALLLERESSLGKAIQRLLARAA